MKEVVRFGVSVDADLLELFDAYCKRKGFNNRSDALRQCIRKELQEDALTDADTQVSGVLSLIYDHNNSDLPRKLTALQHEVHDMVMTSIHIHLDRNHCLEVMILKGANAKVKDLAHKLSSVRGVLQGDISISCVKTLSAQDNHSHKH